MTSARRIRAPRLAAAVLALPVLAACGSVGTTPQAASGETPPPPSQPAPTVTLTSSAAQVTSGGSATLSWSTTNAQSCTASGAWTGARATSGSESTGPLGASATYTLACSGPGGNAQSSVTVSVGSAPPPAAPTVTLAANPASVATGGTSTLTWSSSNATSCTASGAWSGSRPTAGTETTATLTATASYTLTCANAVGATASQSATVTVTTTTPAPTLSFSASASSIASGGSATLTWSSTNATTCAASGGWSGTQPTSGSVSTGTLTSTTTFGLACTGAGGTASRALTITVQPASGTAGVAGRVDSSLVDAVGTNRVYVFAGDVAPQDVRGAAGDPLHVVPVVQDGNACTYSYQSPELAAGTYTIAFTNEAANDRAGAADTIAFTGRRVITVGATPVAADFAAARVLQVGPGRQYATIRAAAAAVTEGTVVDVAAGEYPDDIVVWRTNRVVVRGTGGGRAHVKATRLIDYAPGDDLKNGKGLFVVRGTGMRIENLEFSGAKVPDANGAGIRNEGRNLTICNSSFHDNENGILGGAYGTLTIEYSEFDANGIGEFGRTHNIYVDDGSSAGDRLVFRYNASRRAVIGHELKTRARENWILYNRLTDETGTASYNIDVPNGGLTYVIGNLIHQGTRTDNSTLVNYGAEGLSSGRAHELYLVNNTLVNDLGSGTFADVASGTATFVSTNNLFVGAGALYRGKAPSTTSNLQSSTPLFVDQANFDYRLTSGSPARDAGSVPGTVGGVSLVPAFQYVHPARRQARPSSDGRTDVGAYEF